MTSAFHQIELDQDSQFITAFQSNTRIKPFIRLIFGINSAAEELQHALHTTLADIPRAINVSNNILIFGENTKQHDEILTRVLERYKSKDITLTLEKKVFYKINLKFYGFMFSKKGIKPYPEKIRQIRETPAPENKIDLQSFLGLTNFMKRFRHDHSTQTNYLRELLQEDKDYIWIETHEQAVHNLKQSLNTESCVSYFDNHKGDICLHRR